MPESLEHLLLRCQHPELARLRLQARSDLQRCIDDLVDVQVEVALDHVVEANRVRNHDTDPLASPPLADFETMQQISEESVRAQAPNLELDDVFLAVLMCCTAAGSTLHRLHPADINDTIESRRQRPEVAISQDRIQLTANWLRPVMSIWPRAVATGSLTKSQALLSQNLLTTIARHSQSLYAIRRKLLRRDEAFSCRHRDPPSTKVFSSQTAETHDDGVIDPATALASTSHAVAPPDATVATTKQRSSRRPKRTRTS
jgi:hypothetical protein